MNRTKEYLQPNPGMYDRCKCLLVISCCAILLWSATRAKLSVSSKIKGSKTHSYPQPEGTLGDVMCKYGKDLGEDSSFGWLCLTSDHFVY